MPVFMPNTAPGYCLRHFSICAGAFEASLPHLTSGFLPFCGKT